MAKYKSRKGLEVSYNKLLCRLKSHHVLLIDKLLPARETYSKDFEFCKRDALKYKTRNDWSNFSQAAYAKACRAGWLEDCCTHMPKPKSNKAHTLESCMADALKYERKVDWEKGNSGSYTAALKNKWMELCTVHMLKSRDTNSKKLEILKFIKANRRKPSKFNVSDDEKKLSNVMNNYCAKTNKCFDPKFKKQLEQLCKKLGI